MAQLTLLTLLSALNVKAVHSSETSLNSYQNARRDIPKDCFLHSDSGKNVKRMMKSELCIQMLRQPFVLETGWAKVQFKFTAHCNYHEFAFHLSRLESRAGRLSQCNHASGDEYFLFYFKYCILI
jgi:hypothetical protein